MVQKVSSPEDMNTSPPVSYDDSTQQYAYQEYAFQQMPMVYPPPVYPVARFDQPTAYYDPQRLVQPTHTHPNSPDSVSSTSSPPTPPSSLATTKLAHPPTVTMHPSSSTSTTCSTSSASSSSSSSSSSSNNSIATPYTNNHLLTSQALDSPNVNAQPSSTTSPMINPLVPSSFSNATTARVKETIARANSVPMEFYHTEFLEYSKETYEKKLDAKRNKRKRPSQQQSSSPHDDNSNKHTSDHNNSTRSNSSSKRMKKQQGASDEKEDSDDELDEDEMEKAANEQGLCSAELRRQIHIQSEQKRRAQIKDGFDELRKHLPGCNNKKMSKAALLTRTVQQMQHLKLMQTELLSEVERLVQENDNLKKFQHGVLQRQAMEKMYNF